MGCAGPVPRMKIPNDSLIDRVALVTGGGSGIGKSAAKLLAHAGAKIAVLGRTPDELNETVAEIVRTGGEAISLVADISRADDMELAIRQIEATWGRLDIVFANAGINGVWAPLEELSPEEWDRTIGINLRGTYLTVRAALPLLKKRGGSVIITSSVNGTRMFSNTGASAYAVSKAGQVAFSRMIALELAPQKIRVNTICPGAIETAIGDNTQQRDLEKVKTAVKFPSGKVPLTGGEPGTAGQVAEVVWFLASDVSSHVTGAEIFVDGAQSLLQG